MKTIIYKCLPESQKNIIDTLSYGCHRKTRDKIETVMNHLQTENGCKIPDNIFVLCNRFFPYNGILTFFPCRDGNREIREERNRFLKIHKYLEK